MGYSFGYNDNGRLVRSCDRCGAVGGVRKRTCRFKVTYAEGYSLPYCYPPALCSDCAKKLKPLHGESCQVGAAKATAREVERKARLVSGDFEVRSAFGHWHPAVPQAWVGVRFVSLNGDVWKLLPATDYNGAGGWLSEYPTAVDWPEHP